MKASELILANLYNNVSHRETLEQFLKSSKEVRVICPFISMNEARWLLERKMKGCTIEIITEINPKGITSGVQDERVLQYLYENDVSILFFTSNLHAKFYWFDRKNAVITSANLTANGLEMNFEMGILLQNGKFDGSQGHAFQKELNAYLGDIWDFTSRMALKWSTDTFERFSEIRIATEDLRKEMNRIVEAVKVDLPKVGYMKFQKDIINKQNIQTELLMTKMFSGFHESHWDIFEYNKQLNDQNLTEFKKLLDQHVTPVLRKFFAQLKAEPIFTENFKSLDEGFSRNIQLKNYFPDNRYLFLTKPRPGKKSYKHIGEPSYIIGMGKRTSNGWGRFLEVRSGVEEAYLNALTDSGQKFLENIIKNIDEVMAWMRRLTHGWHLVHGSYLNGSQVTISCSELDKKQLVNICNSYLASRAIADLNFRRVYCLDDKEDREKILSQKVTAIIAEDFQVLKFIFELAHR